MAKKAVPQHALDNRSRQLDPSQTTYHRSRGASPSEAAALAAEATAPLDNRSDQLNEENEAYWSSRGMSERPATSDAVESPGSEHNSSTAQTRGD